MWPALYTRQGSFRACHRSIPLVTDRTICAFETSRRAGASSRVGGPVAGAPRGAGFCGLWRSRCVFASRKPLAGGYPRTPRTTSARHVQPARRCPGSAACPEKGAERRGRITGQVAHTGHPATASRWAMQGTLTPVSVARSSTARMSSSFAGSPKPGVLLPLRGSSSCVTGDPGASDSARPPPKRPESP